MKVVSSRGHSVRTTEVSRAEERVALSHLGGVGKGGLVEVKLGVLDGGRDW